VVKTLIAKKTSNYPTQKAPLPNLGDLSPGWEPVCYAVEYWLFSSLTWNSVLSPKFVISKVCS